MKELCSVLSSYSTKVLAKCVFCCHSSFTLPLNITLKSCCFEYRWSSCALLVYVKKTVQIMDLQVIYLVHVSLQAGKRNMSAEFRTRKHNFFNYRAEKPLSAGLLGNSGICSRKSNISKLCRGLKTECLLLLFSA